MSFTSIVKNEVVHIKRIETEIISEFSAIIRNNGVLDKEIKITTENASLARFIYKEMKELYDINIKVTVRKGYNFHKSYIYILEIKKKINEILEGLGLMSKNRYQIVPPSYIVDDEDLIRAYLRGVFLACGSVNDPKTSRYHLEFLVDNEAYASFISNLLNHFRLGSKVLKRDTKYMVYIKGAEKIGDFLRIIKAMNAVLYFEDIRIYRDHKNMTNRLNNCEQANVDKIIQTSNEQVKEIELLRQSDTYELLDEKLKEVAEYRLKYPETSLLELSEIISLETGNKITKSGLHHRFKKISSLAEKVRRYL